MDNYIKENTIYQHDAIDFMRMLYEDYGDESIDLFLCDFPYTYKGKKRVTANSWDLPIDDAEFFDIALKLLTKKGSIVLTASQPFTSYLVMNHINFFKYEWVWVKDNGSNFVQTHYQPFKIHESVLVFSKSPASYNKKENYMLYNPQFTDGKPYKMRRNGMPQNLATSKEYERTSGEYDGKRYPKSVLKFSTERGFHPTQKPVSLFQYMIATYTDPGMTVVDVCCGSGTTGIAAINSNRNYILNDSNYEYANLAKQRIDNEINKLVQEEANI